MMLQWNLLYTGITRGRKLVVIVGSKGHRYCREEKANKGANYALTEAVANC